MEATKEKTAIRSILTNEDLWAETHNTLSRFSNEFRAMFHYKMGKYDENYGNTIPIETMFMYLFRRFGPPALPYDDYKSLFSYGFQVGDTKFTLHGSYHEHVYLNLWGSVAEIEAYNERRKAISDPWHDGLAKHLADNGLLPWSTSLIGYKIKGETKKKVDALWLELMKAELGDDYDRVNAIPDEGFREDAAFKAAEMAVFHRQEPLVEVCNKEYCKASPAPWMFEPNIYRDGIKKTMAWLSKEFPNTFKDTLAFVKEMRTATYTRDVQFNLAGYESKPDTSKVDWEQKYKVLDTAMTKTYGVSHLANMLAAGMDVKANIKRLKEVADTARDETKIGYKKNVFTGYAGYTDYTDGKQVSHEEE